MVEKSAVGDILVDQNRLLQLDAAPEEADKAPVVDLAEDSDFIQDLIGAFGVSELGALDGDSGAVAENAFVDLAVAAGTQKAVDGEVVGGPLDVFAGEDLCSPSGSAVGVQNCFTLPR